MSTVGQILKETRESKYYSLDEVEKAIKIRKELLVALEADDYSKLPPPTFVQGFIKNYAKFLGLDREKLLAIFRREFSDKKNRPYVMDTFAKPLQEKRLKITPARVLAVVVSVLVLVFFTYLWFQYRQFMGAPNLALVSPQDQLTTDNAAVRVEGKTDSEAQVMINNQEVMVGLDGVFSEEVTLSAPSTKITVTAVSKFGKKVELERIVYLKR